MRPLFVLVAILCGTGGGAMPPAGTGQMLTGDWQRCEAYRDSTVCASLAGVQNGARVCAVRQDFATSAYYTHRLTGTATGNRVHFDAICGDPGSETDSFCTGQAPEGARNVGWASYDRTLHVCEDRLVDDPAGCRASRRAGIALVPAGRLSLSDADRDWLASCAAGVPGARHEGGGSARATRRPALPKASPPAAGGRVAGGMGRWHAIPRTLFRSSSAAADESRRAGRALMSDAMAG